MAMPKVYLKFIDLVSYWEGSINASHLVKYFAIVRQQASKYIDQYQALMPHNLRYDNKLKTYHATEDFTPLYTDCDLHEYMALAQGSAHACYPQLLSVQHLNLPPRASTPQIVRPLISAMRKQVNVNINYSSLNAPQGQGRIIAPHSFAFTGLRWHVRAYCYSTNAYRDFVLNRFNSAELAAPVSATLPDDEAWQRIVDVILAPDPRLSAAQQQLIARDYTMQGGQLRISVRACLAGYLLQSLHISTKVLDAKPEAQQLICTNLNELTPWLFN